MPEGHTIHRHARLQREHLVDRRVEVTSPQGRFADGAAQLDGQRISEIEPYGKHLFYQWDGGEILHIHLGLFGTFRTYRGEAPPPTEGTRLAMITDSATIYLAGPTACELISPAEQEEVISRLGPDPLRPRAKCKVFSERLDRRTVPIAAALLDQKVIAGIGNVYRADLTREQLRRGERAGRIVTVEPHDVGARRRSELDRRNRLYGYKRAGEPCRRCATPIAPAEIGNRKTWWCPTCQPQTASTGAPLVADVEAR